MTMCVVRPSYSLMVPARMPSFFGRTFHYLIAAHNVTNPSNGENLVAAVSFPFGG